MGISGTSKCGPSTSESWYELFACPPQHFYQTRWGSLVWQCPQGRQSTNSSNTILARHENVSKFRECSFKKSSRSEIYYLIYLFSGFVIWLVTANDLHCFGEIRYSKIQNFPILGGLENCSRRLTPTRLMWVLISMFPLQPNIHTFTLSHYCRCDYVIYTSFK